MDITLLLAKVFGLYMIIAGTAIFLNRKHMMVAVSAIFEEKFAQLVAGIVSLLLGLLLVNVQHDWSSVPAALVTLVGWSVLAKGMMYLFLPEAKLAKLIAVVKGRSWFKIEATVAVIIGLYLAAFGFEWF